jgi:hypothetical protein
LHVTTALWLTPKLRKKITYPGSRPVRPGPDLRFTTSTELLAGIEMLTSSRKIAWSMGNYSDTGGGSSQAFEEIEKSEAA